MHKYTVLFYRRRDHEDCVGVWKIIKTKEDFDLGTTNLKGIEVTQKNRTVIPVCTSRPYPTLSLSLSLSLSLFLTLPIHTFRVMKGKEKKQIIFLYISVAVFLSYTTDSPNNLKSSDLKRFSSIREMPITCIEFRVIKLSI